MYGWKTTAAHPLFTKQTLKKWELSLCHRPQSCMDPLRSTIGYKTFMKANHSHAFNWHGYIIKGCSTIVAQGQKFPIIFGGEDIKHWHCDWKLINKSSPHVKPKQNCQAPLCLGCSRVHSLTCTMFELFHFWGCRSTAHPSWQANQQNTQCILLIWGSSNYCIN